MSPNMDLRASSSRRWSLIFATRTKSTPVKLLDRFSRVSTLPRPMSLPRCLKFGKSSWASRTSISTWGLNGSSECPPSWSALEATSQCTTRPPKSESRTPTPSGSRSSNISRLCSKTAIPCTLIRIALSRQWSTVGNSTVKACCSVYRPSWTVLLPTSNCALSNSWKRWTPSATSTRGIGTGSSLGSPVKSNLTPGTRAIRPIETSLSFPLMSLAWSKRLRRIIQRYIQTVPLITGSLRIQKMTWVHHHIWFGRSRITIPWTAKKTQSTKCLWL